MKILLWITRLAACAAAALAIPLHADEGRTNAKDQIANTYATQPQKKLHSEMDAAEQAELSHGDTGMSSSGASAAGTRGAAAPGDAPRAGEEVREKLGKSSRVTGTPPRNGLSRPEQEREKAR